MGKDLWNRGILQKRVRIASVRVDLWVFLFLGLGYIRYSKKSTLSVNLESRVTAPRWSVECICILWSGGEKIKFINGGFYRMSSASFLTVFTFLAVIFL